MKRIKGADIGFVQQDSNYRYAICDFVIYEEYHPELFGKRGFKVSSLKKLKLVY